MDQKSVKKGCLYHIRLKGVLSPESFSWVDDARIVDQDNNETLLAIRIVDQPALRGIMDQLWNLNLTILSVKKVENIK